MLPCASNSLTVSKLLDFSQNTFFHRIPRGPFAFVSLAPYSLATVLFRWLCHVPGFPPYHHVVSVSPRFRKSQLVSNTWHLFCFVLFFLTWHSSVFLKSINSIYSISNGALECHFFMFQKELLLTNTHYGKHHRLEKWKTEKHFYI